MLCNEISSDIKGNPGRQSWLRRYEPVQEGSGGDLSTIGWRQSLGCLRRLSGRHGSPSVDNLRLSGSGEYPGWESLYVLLFLYSGCRQFSRQGKGHSALPCPGLFIMAGAPKGILSPEGDRRPTGGRGCGFTFLYPIMRKEWRKIKYKLEMVSHEKG